jgi:saccharopine dehydrogenase-like NADP-dependent oxidoreductase
MRIGTLGAGAIGSEILRNLLEISEADELLVVDADGRRAEACVRALGDRRLRAAAADANRIEETAECLRGCAVVVNAAQYYVNVEVMRACLRAGCHYLDLGGLFHMTRRQLELGRDFERTGLTAVLGIGAAPGITNVLARCGYDRLDEVLAARLSFAGESLGETPKVDVFVPPYSIRTIMEEFTETSWQFLDGDLRELPPLSGAEEIDFPAPIGRRRCFHTLHSEPATIPEAFRNKGIREVTWKLSFTQSFEDRCRTLALVGLGSKEPLEVSGSQVVPLDFLAALVERTAAERLKGASLETHEIACMRAQVEGKRKGKPVEIVVDCIARTPPHGSSIAAYATALPPAVTARMLATGRIGRPGAWGPESVIPPDLFCQELSRRGMRIEITERTTLD